MGGIHARIGILRGPGAPRALAFGPNDLVKVGRIHGASRFAVPDPFLSPVHFSLECKEDQCILRDATLTPQKHPRCTEHCFRATLRQTPCQGSQCRVFDRNPQGGVYVNAKKVTETSVQHGAIIAAGSTTFQLALGQEPWPLEATPKDVRPPTLDPSAERAVLTLFANIRTPLYAILDAARDPAVLDTLRMHGELFYSLYDGAQGEALEEVAPHLVELRPNSPLFIDLVRHHWGESWGVFLHAEIGFEAVRRHLRQFLKVEDDEGKRQYFRFYDPRVLRTFLPTCTPEETHTFMGSLQDFIVESHRTTEVLVFSSTERGLRAQAVEIGGARP